MTRTKPILLLAALISLALLGVGYILQHVYQMAPCPLCILQRYAFAAVALISLLFLLLPAGAARAGATLAALAALVGAGVAGRHLWVKANPDLSCGIDPLETALNRFPTAEWMPFLFKADGLCSADYAPILGLSIPQWALIWFVLLAAGLIAAALRNGRRARH